MSLWIIVCLMLAFLLLDRRGPAFHFSFAGNAAQAPPVHDSRFDNLLFFGGGGSPDVNYANTIQAVHSAFLTGNPPNANTLSPEEFEIAYGGYPTIADFVINALEEGSPWEGEDPYDPEEDITALQEAVENMVAAVERLDPATGSTILADAVQWVQDNMPDLIADSVDTEVDAAIAANQELSLNEHAAAVSRVKAGLYDIRASQSSQFGVAIALMESTRGAALQRESAMMRVAVFRERASLAAQLLNTFLGQYRSALDARRLAFATTFDFTKMRNTAMSQQIQQRIAFKSQNAAYPVEYFQYIGNFIGAANGAVMAPRAATKGEHMVATVSNALAAGFNAGAQAGSPEAGIAVGVGTGLLSLGASWISDNVR